MAFFSELRLRRAGATLKAGHRATDMKLLPHTAWLRALRRWRDPRRKAQDPAEMGTAFGLDSITVIDFESTSAQDGTASSSAQPDWQRRVARRSGL